MLNDHTQGEEVWAALHVETLQVGLVWGDGVVVEGSTPSWLRQEMEEAVQTVAGLVAGFDGRHDQGERMRRHVRDSLRHGRFRPTGRSKPASEYLAQSAREGRFPFINSVVDVANLVSLRHAVPISLVDWGKVGSRNLVIRRGREGESYAFNPVGQVLELKDLVLAASSPADRPFATPVKDSQCTKIDTGTSSLLGLIYMPRELHPNTAGHITRDLATVLGQLCPGALIGHEIITPNP